MAGIGALIFIILYFLALIGFGIWGQRRTTSEVRDFFVAKGQIGTVLLFMTSLATGFSAFTFVGAIGLGYSLGINGLILAGGALIFATPGVVWVGKRIWALGKKYGYITPSDFLADRFNSPVIRILVALIAVGFSFFYIQVQLVGMGHIISVLTGDLIAYRTAVVISALLIGVYVAIGGMRAVVYSDVLQGILLTLGLLVLSVFAVGYIVDGAMKEAATAAPAVNQITLSPLYLWTVSVGYGLSVCVWPQFLVRYFAAKRVKGVFTVGVANDAGSIVLLTVFAGFISYVGVTVFKDIAPDTVTVNFIKLLPLALAWPMAAAGAAAAQSTADSILLMCAGVYTKDIHASYISPKASEKQLSLVGHIVTVVLIVLAMVAALSPPESLLKVVLNLAYPGYLLLLPVSVAAVWWRRATTPAAIAALFVGLVTLVFTIFIWPDALNIYSGVWGFVTSSIALVVVSLLTRPPAQGVIDRIHNYLDSEADYAAIEET